MRVEGIAVALRPRSQGEAADLGLALVRQHARSVWLTFAPVYGVVALLALCTVDTAAWLPALIVFCLKPWLDRSLLFVLARAVFGESTRFADLWRARRHVFFGQFLRTMFWRRLSPWRSFTQPVEQLEGQRGSERRKRVKLLLNDNRGAASALLLAFVHAEAVFVYSGLALVFWFAPEGSRHVVWDWFWHADKHAAGQLLLDVLSSISYLSVVFVLEPFYVAAGFAMYLNRRVALEAWDIEQEFRNAFA
jgi:hypothetical protein